MFVKPSLMRILAPIGIGAAILGLLNVTIDAQDRLKAMPGYAQ